MTYSTTSINEADRLDPKQRTGLCRVFCGTLAVGVCLHLLAAVAAVALGVAMIVIAVAGPVAPWIGGIVIGSLATFGIVCLKRRGA